MSKKSDEQIAHLQGKLLEACEEIIYLRRESNEMLVIAIEIDAKAQREKEGALKACEDLAIECAFWKRACEQALRMWESAQDDLDQLEYFYKGYR